MSITLTIAGMSCEHCERTVDEALSGVDGVTEVTVDRASNAATVHGETDVEALVSVVERAGYTVEA